MRAIKFVVLSLFLVLSYVAHADSNVNCNDFKDIQLKQYNMTLHFQQAGNGGYILSTQNDGWFGRSYAISPPGVYIYQCGDNSDWTVGNYFQIFKNYVVFEGSFLLYSYDLTTKQLHALVSPALSTDKNFTIDDFAILANGAILLRTSTMTAGDIWRDDLFITNVSGTKFVKIADNISDFYKLPYWAINSARTFIAGSLENQKLFTYDVNAGTYYLIADLGFRFQDDGDSVYKYAFSSVAGRIVYTVEYMDGKMPRYRLMSSAFDGSQTKILADNIAVDYNCPWENGGFAELGCYASPRYSLDTCEGSAQVVFRSQNGVGEAVDSVNADGTGFKVIRPYEKVNHFNLDAYCGK